MSRNKQESGAQVPKPPDRDLVRRAKLAKQALLLVGSITRAAISIRRSVSGATWMGDASPYSSRTVDLISELIASLEDDTAQAKKRLQDLGK